MEHPQQISCGTNGNDIIEKEVVTVIDDTEQVENINSWLMIEGINIVSAQP